MLVYYSTELESSLLRRGAVLVSFTRGLYTRKAGNHQLPARMPYILWAYSPRVKLNSKNEYRERLLSRLNEPKFLIETKANILQLLYISEAKLRIIYHLTEYNQINLSHNRSFTKHIFLHKWLIADFEIINIARYWKFIFFQLINQATHIEQCT